MGKRAYSEINLHIVWHVKDNSPVLTEHVEVQLYRFLRGRAVREAGVFWHDSGGTDDHVHLAVTVAPTLGISEWIGQMKGASAHFINHEIVNRKLLEWQSGYGVVSFGRKDMLWVLDYIRKQREHHATGRVHDRLERIETEEEKPLERG